MLKNWRKACTFALAGMLLLVPIINASGGQTTLSQEEYDKQFQGYLETYVATPELVSTWEYGLLLYPENNQLRYYLVLTYSNTGQNDKAKACAKEALQYEPNSSYFAYLYLMFCSEGVYYNETQEAAEYLLDITLPLLPPAGQTVDQYELRDISNYPYLKYCMNAVQLLQAIYTERGDEEIMLQYSDWILQRKDDSDLGYEFGLVSMYGLAVYYGRTDRFSEMEYWIDEYFAFEPTADSRGEDWIQKQELLQQFTDVLQEIDNAYLEQGDEMDIDAIFEDYTSQ